MKRLRNTSGIPDETVKNIVDWIAGRLGISGFDVECRSSQHTFAGRAYTQGARYGYWCDDQERSVLRHET